MKLEDRLRRDLPLTVDDLSPSSASWNGIERGLIRHRRRTIAARVALATVVLGAFVGILTWAASVYLREEPTRRVPAATPSPTVSSPLVGEVSGFQPLTTAFSRFGVGLAAGSTPGTCGVDVPCGGAIERTTDDGRTWTLVYSTDAPIGSLTPVNDVDESWALVDRCREVSAPSCQNVVLYSSDAGQTWRELSRAPVHGEITFGDSNRGWALSDQADPSSDSPRQPFATTIDGGRTWVDMASPCPRTVSTPVSVDLVTSLHGWVACSGEPATIQEGKAIFETTDGGATWEPRAQILSGADEAGDLTLSGHSPQIFFQSHGRGWLWMGRDCLYISTDRGLTWTRTGADICSPDVTQVFAAQFFGDDGIALMWSPNDQAHQLIETHDAGASWTVKHAWPVP